MKIKVLLFLVLLFSLPMTGFSQSTVGGVITYHFNKYQGDKPDLGSKVFLGDSTKLQGFDSGVVENFMFGKSYRHLYASALELHTYYSDLTKKTDGKKSQKEAYEKYKASLDDAEKNLERVKAQLVKYGADTDEKFKALDEQTTLMLSKIKAENSSQKTVDASGNYSFNVTPGTYYVYITSKNRTGLSLTEILGRVYLEKVKVGENQSMDVSHNFEVY